MVEGYKNQNVIKSKVLPDNNHNDAGSAHS